VGLCISKSLQGDDSVKAFLQKGRIGGGIIFYAVRVV
jgi:hypothetical protein